MEVNSRVVTVEIERSDHSLTVRTGLSVEDAADAIRGLEGEADVTVTISPDGIDERLRVAVDCAWAFVGLERSDGVFQYVADTDDRVEIQPFTIGGQEVDMDSRYVSPVATAAEVVEEWLRTGESSSHGCWERQ